VVCDPEGSKLVAVIYVVSNLVKTFHDHYNAKFNCIAAVQDID